MIAISMERLLPSASVCTFSLNDIVFGGIHVCARASTLYQKGFIVPLFDSLHLISNC